MSLASIGLCTIDPVDRPAGKFDVTVNSDDGNQLAIFACSSEHDALRLRTAIREHADRLRRVADYRERQVKAPAIEPTVYTPGTGWQYTTPTGVRYGNFDTEAEALAARVVNLGTRKALGVSSEHDPGAAAVNHAGAPA
jgi:hypothetical protein